MNDKEANPQSRKNRKTVFAVAIFSIPLIAAVVASIDTNLEKQVLIFMQIITLILFAVMFLLIKQNPKKLKLLMESEPFFAPVAVLGLITGAVVALVELTQTILAI